MTVEDQKEMYGASVGVVKEHVVLQLGSERVFLSPKEAKVFMGWLAHAYMRASGEIGDA